MSAAISLRALLLRHSRALAARPCSVVLPSQCGRGHGRTWWGRVKLSLICSASQRSAETSSLVGRGAKCRGDAAPGLVGVSTCLVIDGLGVASSLQRSPDGGRASSEGCTGDAEGVHDGCGGPIDVYGFRRPELFAIACRREPAPTNFRPHHVELMLCQLVPISASSTFLR